MNTFLKKYRFKKNMLLMLLATAPAALILNGCKQQETPTEETPPIVDINYNKEDYYNRFPIQIYIDENFSDTNKQLMQESLEELDMAINGLTFEYNTWNLETLGLDNYHSYILIQFDKEGKYTINSYEEPTADKPLAFATRAVYADFLESQNGKNYRIENFASNLVMGNYFGISEDIPDTNKLMSLEVKWSNFVKFDAYNSSSIFSKNSYWGVTSTYNAFKENIENAYKGLLKHEVGHSLGFEGDTNINCALETICHSSNKNSLMYPYLSPSNSIGNNIITHDVVNFFKEKYPSKDNQTETPADTVNSKITFLNNGVQIALSSTNQASLSNLNLELQRYLKQKNSKTNNDLER